MDKRKYAIVNTVLNAGRNITVDKECNAWMAVNKGDQLVYVNGFPLKPYPPGHPELSGEFYGVDGNENEIFDGDIKVVFDVSVGTNPFVVISQKYYKS